VVAEGTGAGRSDVWLRLGDRLTLAASWPVSEPDVSFAIDGDELPPLDADRVAPVRHQGELLGAIAVIKPASDRSRPGRRNSSTISPSKRAWCSRTRGSPPTSRPG
jgi:hypothetical protein